MNTTIQRAAISLTILFCVQSLQAAEPLRIWVDHNGQFSVEARLLKVNENEVVLLRGDGGKVVVPTYQLSERDKDYLADVEARSANDDNPLRIHPPEQPNFKPLPALDLPAAKGSASAGTSLEMQAGKAPQTTKKLPKALQADPSPHSFGAVEARIPIYKVDVYDDCSAAIPITTTVAGTRTTSIVMSVSSGFSARGQTPKNQLIRYDLGKAEAFVVYNHPKRIRLLDHHAASGRSLVLTDFNSLGKGGQFAVASGWDDSEFQISHQRPLATIAAANAPHVRWARWVDEEHFVAVIDQSFGLWNIVSGKQVYRVQGIDHRADPAISGGRRYVAIPFPSAVHLYDSQTGKILGRIGVEKQLPGVSFSPTGNTLAIATSRRLRNWDLPSAALSSDTESRTSLGLGSPVWVDSDLVLTSSGVLISNFRALPIWRYDISSAKVTEMGRHLAMFRKHPGSELSVIALPHRGAKEAMSWIDDRPAHIDRAKWRLLGRSSWTTSGWNDRDVQISALPADRLR